MGRLFGTDGIRGIANKDITCERAMEIGRAAAMILGDGCRKDPVFLIGSDTRASSDMIIASMSAGICSVGANVINIGVVPTPAVAYLIGKYKADAGIMISASHNPAEFNGIKIFNGNGYKLADILEERIEEIVLDKIYPITLAESEKIGKIRYEKNAIKDYIRHIKSFVYKSLDGLKIAIDCANGSASASAATLFSELGAEIHVLSAAPDGQNINLNCGSTHIEALSKFVIENKLDCGIAFDGDADRCLCVDENGSLIDGDHIMAICALDLMKRGKLNKSTVVGTVLTNLGFIKFCEENGLKFIASKVGDRYVLENMLLDDYSFGGEQSGHIIFRDFATTGDGQLTATQLLSLMKIQNQPLSKLASVMTKYPQVCINVDASPEGKIAFYTDKIIDDSILQAKEQLGEDGRIVVRPSGTEPFIRIMVEGKTESEITDIANKVAATITEQLREK